MVYFLFTKVVKSRNRYPANKAFAFLIRKRDKCLVSFLLPQEAESLQIPVFLKLRFEVSLVSTYYFTYDIFVLKFVFYQNKFSIYSVMTEQALNKYRISTEQSPKLVRLIHHVGTTCSSGGQG
jgi:hypothetical protein